MDNLDKLMDLFDDLASKAVDTSDPYIDKAVDKIEAGLDKAIGAGFRFLAKRREKKDAKASENA